MKRILLLSAVALSIVACSRQGPVDPDAQSITIDLPAVKAAIVQRAKANPEVAEAMSDKTGPCGSHDAIEGKIEAAGLELDHMASPVVAVYTSGYDDGAKLYLVKRGSRWCAAGPREALAPING